MIKNLLALVFLVPALVFGQPMPEIDPYSIHVDGSSTTTSSIGFAEGLSIPDGESILLGDASSRLTASGGSISLIATGSHSNLDIQSAGSLQASAGTYAEWSAGTYVSFNAPDIIFQTGFEDYLFAGSTSSGEFYKPISFDSTISVGSSLFSIDPNASTSNPILNYTVQGGRQYNWRFSGTDSTSYAGANSYIAANVTQTMNGAANIAALFDFDFTDSRNVNTSGTDFRRLLDFQFNRTSYTNSLSSSTYEGAKFNMIDSGTYSRSAGVAVAGTPLYISGSINPTIQATSGSGTYTYTGLKDDTSISGNGNTFTSGTIAGHDIGFTYFQFPSVVGFNSSTLYGIYYHPSVTIVSGSSTEHALYASRSGITLASDGTAGTYSGGNIRMGASLDWQQFYEADNEAVNDIPTGAVYDWRINAIDQMSLGLRSLTLGDNTSNDFTITFNQANDSTLRWDSADKNLILQADGSSEFLYPFYDSRFTVNAINDNAVGGSRFATQFWIKNTGATSNELGGFWGGVYEEPGSGAVGFQTAYGLVAYNFLQGTNARTGTNVYGLYAGNEINAGGFSGTDVAGIYTNPFDGGADVVAVTNSYGVLIPTVSLNGGTITNDYGIRINKHSAGTNNYEIFLNGASGSFYRAGTQAVWSSAASALDFTANTTYNFKIGANPATGTAGTNYATFKSTGLAPVTNNQIDLGTSSLGYRSGYFSTSILPVSDNAVDAGSSSFAYRSIYASTDINIEAGSSAVFGEVGGRISQNTADVGNIGSGEDDLITYSVAGNTLANDGESLHWVAAGNFAATAANKRIRCYFGSDTLIDTGALAVTAASSWKVEGWILRTGAATQDQMTEIQTSDALLASSVSNTAITRTLSSSNTLKCTGEATNNNDIVNSFQIVNWEASN